MNSSQLELGLNDARAVIPWSGRSPRELTRVGLGLFLKRERQEVTRLADARQCEMFIEHQARRYSGAPLLLPLRREARFRF